MTDEWFWAALICGAPLFAFGALEAFAASRPRRSEAVARRSKPRARGRRP